MISSQIPLQQVEIDIERGTDLTSVAEAEAIRLLTQVYSFLPSPIAVEISDSVATISSAGESRATRKMERLFEQAGAEVRGGLMLFYGYVAASPYHTAYF